MAPAARRGMASRPLLTKKLQNLLAMPLTALRFVGARSAFPWSGTICRRLAAVPPCVLRLRASVANRSRQLSGAHQPVSTVLEAYELLSSPSGEGRALHKSCYVAANGFQIIL